MYQDNINKPIYVKIKDSKNYEQFNGLKIDITKGKYFIIENEEGELTQFKSMIDASKFLMEQKSLTRKDLEPYLGTRARVSEVLNKKRSLTLPMIKRLHEGLNIPYNCLIAPHKTDLWEKFQIKKMMAASTTILGMAPLLGDVFFRARLKKCDEI